MKLKLIIILCNISIIMYAQDRFDIFTYTLRTGALANYDSLALGTARERAISFELSLPIQFNDGKTTLLTRLSYYKHNIVRDNTLLYLTNPKSLHAVFLQTGVLQQFENNTNMIILFSPRLMSDKAKRLVQKVQLGFVGIYGKEYSKNLSLGIGLAYNNEEFGHYFSPLINIYWKPNSKFSIQGVFPAFTKISYHNNDRLTLGLNYFGLAGSYPLSDIRYKQNYLTRENIDLSLFGRYNVFSDFFVELNIGHTLGRMYEQYPKNEKVTLGIPLVYIGDNRKTTSELFEDSFFGELKFIYSVKVP